jgi:20S proteasome subunit alpha 2
MFLANRTNALFFLVYLGDDMNFSLTTFDKSGKLNQIEYALTRVSKGKMALGIKATNGVVIATDKKVQTSLFDGDDYQKAQTITPSTGFIYAGMGPDFRLVVKNARKNAQA